MQKIYITPDQLRLDSYKLGAKVVNDGFQPDFMVALWRGGAPIGCYIHELLKWKGYDTDHVAIRTSKYTGIGEVGNKVSIHNLGYFLSTLKPDSKVLIVDDVWDSGHTIDVLLETITSRYQLPSDKLDIRVATVYYKPTKNKSSKQPNYFIHESTEWLVFPHELEDMSIDEVGFAMGSDIKDVLVSTLK